MNFQIINDGAAAGLTYDINSGFAQMAQMPLRNDVVKTVAVDAPTTPVIPTPHVPLAPGTPIDVSKPKNATTDINPNAPTDAAQKTNWLLIGGIGLGVAALAALVISKRKKNKAKLNGTVGAVSKKTVRTKKTKRKNSSKKGGHKVVTI